MTSPTELQLWKTSGLSYPDPGIVGHVQVPNLWQPSIPEIAGS